MRVASLCLTLLVLVLMVGGSVSADLVAHWTLDEMIGDTAGLSGNGNDGPWRASDRGRRPTGNGLAFNSRVTIPAIRRPSFPGVLHATVDQPPRTGNTGQQRRS